MCIVKLLILYTLYTLHNVSCIRLKEGDACLINMYSDVDRKGVCKPIHDCPYALDLVNVQEKKPPMCRYRDSTRIVCCPLDDEPHEQTTVRTVVTQYDQPTTEAVIRDDHEEVPEAPESPEPAGCPALPKPRLMTDVQHLAWLKCLEYQRYSNRCIPLNKENTIFRRVESCGIARSCNQSDYGTRQATSMEFPHMAVLGFQNNSDEIVWQGSGSLISERFILTASHILTMFGEVKYVLLGAVNKTDPKSGVVYNVKRIIPYAKNSSEGINKDIILLELQQRVMLSEFIRPACLPVPGRLWRRGMIISGWGYSDKVKLPGVLLTTQVLKSQKQCIKKLGASFEPTSMICVRGRAKNPEFKSDSGSPLVAVLKKLHCTYSIEGVAILNTPKRATAIYANVSKYINWITEIAWPDSSVSFQFRENTIN